MGLLDRGGDMASGAVDGHRHLRNVDKIGTNILDFSRHFTIGSVIRRLNDVEMSRDTKQLPCVYIT